MTVLVAIAIVVGLVLASALVGAGVGLALSWSVERREGREFAQRANSILHRYERS